SKTDIVDELAGKVDRLEELGRFRGLNTEKEKVMKDRPRGYEVACNTCLGCSKKVGRVFRATTYPDYGRHLFSTKSSIVKEASCRKARAYQFIIKERASSFSPSLLI
ncbi:MAG: hypothetical protein RI565_09150, partial [Schleiferiaceae bacterium]|nr:hypothetical protein [Schleiferiaceae bacterium]